MGSITEKKCPLMTIYNSTASTVRGSKNSSRTGSIDSMSDHGDACLAIMEKKCSTEQFEYNQIVPDGPIEAADSEGENEKEAKKQKTINAVRVVIPRIDDEETFGSFFVSEKSSKARTNNTDEIDIGSFDAIKPTQRLVHKRTIQLPKGRRCVNNPVKSLASRTDLSTEYTELKVKAYESNARGESLQFIW